MFWRGVLPPLVRVTVVRTISLSTAGVLTRRSASASERCCRTHYASCLRWLALLSYAPSLSALRASWRGVLPSLGSGTVVRTMSFSTYQRARYTAEDGIVIVSVRHVLFQLFKPTRRNEQLTGKIHGEVWGCSLFRLTLHQYQFEINTMVSSR
jgi:hypothetical protein